MASREQSPNVPAIASPERDEVQNSTLIVQSRQSIVYSPDTLDKIIVPIAQKFLPRAKYDKYCLYWNEKKNSFMIGNSIVGLDHNDIV